MRPLRSRGAGRPVSSERGSAERRAQRGAQGPGPGDAVRVPRPRHRHRAHPRPRRVRQVHLRVRAGDASSGSCSTSGSRSCSTRAVARDPGATAERWATAVDAEAPAAGPGRADLSRRAAPHAPPVGHHGGRVAPRARHRAPDVPRERGGRLHGGPAARARIPDAPPGEDRARDGRLRRPRARRRAPRGRGGVRAGRDRVARLRGRAHPSPRRAARSMVAPRGGAAPGPGAGPGGPGAVPRRRHLAPGACRPRAPHGRPGRGALRRGVPRLRRRVGRPDESRGGRLSRARPDAGRAPALPGAHHPGVRGAPARRAADRPRARRGRVLADAADLRGRLRSRRPGPGRAGRRRRVRDAGAPARRGAPGARSAPPAARRSRRWRS